MSSRRLVSALVATSTSLLVLACSSSKAPASQASDQASVDRVPAASATAEPQRVVVPGADPAAAPRMTMNAAENAADAKPGAAPAAADNPFRLQPDEGKLVIEAPAGATAGNEAIARILVTPATKYKINTEFPTKLTLETPAGVVLGKAEFVAGGASKAKGDATTFDEQLLAFDVKLTPAASGSHTINGKFKFAVCDKDTCLAKMETISIAVAAN